MSLYLKTLLIQILMVSPWGDASNLILLNNFTGKLNISLTVYLLVVNGSKIGTKIFASLHAVFCKTDKIV